VGPMSKQHSSLIPKQYEDYIKSGSWRCNASPTDAHFWIEVYGNGNNIKFRCVHCKELKLIPIK